MKSHSVEAYIRVDGASTNLCNGCPINDPRLTRFLALNGFVIACRGGHGQEFTTQIKATSEEFNSEVLVEKISQVIHTTSIAKCASTDPEILP